MSAKPAHAKLYHITHVDNLPSIVAEGCLVSDATMIERGGPAQPIGMSVIKRRRVETLAVKCHPGTKVGDYVPFNFCRRSVMLYVIHCANRLELAYRGGQEPIVHLEADLDAVMTWAVATGCRWAFTRSNAGSFYAEFHARPEELNELDWTAIAATDFRAPEVQERKQAEFLAYGTFPFALVERIGVASDAIARRVDSALAGSTHRPVVEVLTDWYFPRRTRP